MTFGFNPSFSDAYHKRIFQEIPELKNSSFTHKSLFLWSGDISEEQHSVLKFYEELRSAGLSVDMSIFSANQ